MADFAEQRRNMVESQLRTSDVTDRRILAAMLDVPREAFVPPHLRALAYMDGDIRLPAAQGVRGARTMLAPRTFARLIDLARIERGDVVLDVGSASGYSAAVLGRLAETVVALENEPDLVASSAKAFNDLSADNVAVVQGPLAAGWPSAGPYAVIVLEGSVAEVPGALLNDLKDGGRLVGVQSDGAVSRAVVYTRSADCFDMRVAFDVAAPPLPGFEKAPVFCL
jgi:protein-L-isoaspartate(D-aspartate) O-methyltransferase